MLVINIFSFSRYDFHPIRNEFWLFLAPLDMSSASALNLDQSKVSSLDRKSNIRWQKSSFQVNDTEPAVMWLSGLHIPESYLTALVQATCRKNGWPLDKSTLYTAVTKWLNPDEVTEKAHQGMAVLLFAV